MLALTTKDVRMNAKANTKEEALQLLADILHEDGLTHGDYLQGLKNREAKASTYLGQGVAIPHGTPDSRSLIYNTGVRLVHFSNGVIWNDAGDKVYLAAVIAAKSDEHLDILKLLTRTLSDNVEDKIKNAQTADELIAIINGVPDSLLLHENLIKTDVAAGDLDELSYQACTLLKSGGILDSVLTIKPVLTKLSQAIYALILEDDNIHQSALSLVVAKKPIMYQKDKVKALAVIASNAHMDTARLSKVYDVLLSHDFNHALNQSAKQIVRLLHAEEALDWQNQSTQIVNPLGLHARPATLLSDMAKQAKGEIRVSVDNGAFVSAKSLARLLSLGGTHGQTLTFIAEPNTDAIDFLPKLIELVQSGLGEDVVPVQNSSSILHQKSTQQSNLENSTVFTIEYGEKIYATPASSGFAIAKAYVITPKTFSYSMTAKDSAAETEKLMRAIHDVKTDLKKLVENTTKTSIAKIFAAHVALLEDEAIIFGAQDGIDEGLSAAAAWHAHIEAMAKTQSLVGNHLLAERAADLRDIGQKVLMKLTGQDLDVEPDEPYILIKQDLLPSDVAKLDPKKVAGILTAQGGASSHSAIIARALGIPAIVGAGGVLSIHQGLVVLIDGGKGYFVVSPDQNMVNDCQVAQANFAKLKALAKEQAFQPAITKDGHRVEIAANLSNVNDAQLAVKNGAEAVGLLRTELVFMAHHNMPDVQTQILDYQKVFNDLEDRPLVVRTLDVGGDKPLPYLLMPAEENPFLGVRGIRLTLEQPKLLKDQLTALIVASKGRDLRIMFPMIGRIEEWRAAKAILDDVLQEYPHDNLQAGIMMEVPSAAVMAEDFAKEVDFFSVGTNDLTQYTLAIDRGHPTLSKDADGLHPSILRLIDKTVQAAHTYGKWVGVCGELASDEKAVPILLGLGVDELSMSSTSIALTKAQIRELNLQECQTLAKKALSCATSQEVRALIRDE